LSKHSPGSVRRRSVNALGESISQNGTGASRLQFLQPWPTVIVNTDRGECILAHATAPLEFQFGGRAQLHASAGDAPQTFLDIAQKLTLAAPRLI
jgi:hypothetical protein